MSKTQTRRDIAAERDELQAKVDELTSAAERVAQEHAGEIEALNVEMQGKLDEAQAQIEAKDAEIAALTEKVDDQAALIIDGTEELELVQAELSEKKGELATAKEALKNPAVADAVKTEASDENIPAPGSDEEADAAEAKAKLKDADAPKNVLEKFESMEVGEERSQFYADNKVEILKLTDERE